ncbi:DUF6704 family protein [Gryllotalpicola ginsengisoli]|uniref:DUF6704 family protein n=1 Tax=Gryllotalpicola ginsengisoli TaxID=444608 RepID=UPI0003B6F187|nr:DUF6704 family protein [Gryllotalpicola ginsengisoli]
MSTTETHDDLGHGHSPAAWTAVIIMLVAFALGTVFFWLDQPWLVVACGVLLVIGLIVGWIMKRAGYGVGGDKYQPKGH